MKDLTQSFRSTFALVFMFAVPLLVPGMFYLMFGSQAAKSDAVYEPPMTRLVIANLDRGDDDLANGLGPVSSVSSLGALVLENLQNPDLAQLITIELAGSENEARDKVYRQAADAALIIPSDFSENYVDGYKPALATLYSVSSQQVSVEIVRAVVEPVLEIFSGVRIAVDIISPQMMTAGLDPETAAVMAAQQYLQYTSHDPAALLDLRTPKTKGSPLSQMIGPIMGGMLIFFAFFTGGSTAQSILTEAEQGTLMRLFTTPTSHAAILRGKFLAVIMTVLVQVTLLLFIAHMVFGIQWGLLAAAALAAAGIIACAAAFGIFLTSLMKSTRQGGVVYGGLITVSGMLGMLTIFTGGRGGVVEKISLLVPQGWAVRGLTLAMNGAALLDVSVNLLVLLALSSLFFGVGVWNFQRRFV